MGHDPATVPADEPASPRALILEAGRRSDDAALTLVDDALRAGTPQERVSALGALVSQGRFTEVHAIDALGDPSHLVHQRALQLTGLYLHSPTSEMTSALIAALEDDDVVCVVTALVTIGDLELMDAFSSVCHVYSSQRDALITEEAVATLGALGNPAGLDLVLDAMNGKPALRRRCVAALGAFDDPRVEEALDLLAEDRDWQVRQAVAMLRREE